MKVMWLSNLLRFLNNMEQYSGEEQFLKFSTQKQAEQSLRNFDLSEYRRVINDVAIWIYNGVTKLMEEELQPLLVPAIIEHQGKILEPKISSKLFSSKIQLPLHFD